MDLQIRSVSTFLRKRDSSDPSQLAETPPTSLMPIPVPSWNWEPFTPDRTSLSGDISKLWRNEPAKAPGVLSVDAPSDHATVMAREVIQNSWDSAIEAQESRLREWSDFEMRFEFKDQTGKAKQALVSALALKCLAKRQLEWEDHTRARGETTGARAKLGLRPRSCLDDLDNSSIPLKFLIISEIGTTGMYGPWGQDSRMYLALAALGYTPKKEGGGSYGYGKAGLIRGSATRTVIAYSCFRERSDDVGVTRRLFGMTYWGEHEVGTQRYTGFARFGTVTDEGGSVPFENGEADRIASALGLRRRNPADPDGLGTTFLVVEPVVAPDDLRRAVERNWWPVLEDPAYEFSVVIRTADDEELVPRPKRDEVLRSFIEAYEVATVPQDNASAERRCFHMRGKTKGRLGLVADLNGWSYPDATADDSLPDVDHRSLVALLRKPRMVVEYYPVGRVTRPFVRGVFVADDKIDQILRQTEPKGHDCWQIDTSEAADKPAIEVARDVLTKIKRNVAKFRRTLRPLPPPAEEIVLREFDRLMRKLLLGNSRGNRGPVPQPRPFTIRVTPMAEQIGPNRVRVSGQAEFGLSAHCEDDESRATVQLRYKLDEDGGSGTDVRLQIAAPPGFESDGGAGTFVGLLRKGTPAIFDFVSEAHSELWTGRFVAGAQARSRSTG